MCLGLRCIKHPPLPPSSFLAFPPLVSCCSTQHLNFRMLYFVICFLFCTVAQGMDYNMRYYPYGYGYEEMDPFPIRERQWADEAPQAKVRPPKKQCKSFQFVLPSSRPSSVEQCHQFVDEKRLNELFANKEISQPIYNAIKECGNEISNPSKSVKYSVKNELLMSTAGKCIGVFMDNLNVELPRDFLKEIQNHLTSHTKWCMDEYCQTIAKAQSAGGKASIIAAKLCMRNKLTKAYHEILELVSQSAMDSFVSCKGSETFACMKEKAECYGAIKETFGSRFESLCGCWIGAGLLGLEKVCQLD